MIISRASVDAGLLGAVRVHCLQAISRISEAPEYDRGTWALQSGIRLASIECGPLLVLAAALQSECGLPCSLARSSVRLQACDGVRRLRWHQDYAPMGLAEGQVGMVAWVPLDAIDGSRPSLEVARERPRLEHGEDDRAFLVAPGVELAGEVLADMAVGDVAWFSPYEPHRTYIGPWMWRPRLSLDVRFAEGW